MTHMTLKNSLAALSLLLLGATSAESALVSYDWSWTPSEFGSIAAQGRVTVEDTLPLGYAVAGGYGTAFSAGIDYLDIEFYSMLSGNSRGQGVLIDEGLILDPALDLSVFFRTGPIDFAPNAPLDFGIASGHALYSSQYFTDTYLYQGDYDIEAGGYTSDFDYTLVESTHGVPVPATPLLLATLIPVLGWIRKHRS
jgi:hypothetical protein